MPEDKKPHAPAVNKRMGVRLNRVGLARVVSRQPHSTRARPTGEGFAMVAIASVATATDPTEARRQRGLAIAALSRIEQRKSGLWTVPSQSGAGNYWVRLDSDPPTCTCPDFEERSQPCKHVFAVQFTLQRESHKDGTETITESMTVSRQTVVKKPTYRQNWPAYNKAQTTEKHRFQVLLAELCRGIAEPARKPTRGQQPLSLADMVFSADFKVYSTLSCRRFSCDLADAQERGYIDKAPHFNSVLNYLKMPELTPILKALIAQSSLPLKSVECDFAIDSSGFATSRFVRWFDHKYGVVRQKYDWVKVHLMCGVKTNVVTAVEIGGRNAADCPQFGPLFTATRRRFDIREISADSAYLSYDNMDMVGEAGATPFISFKDNTTAAQGGLFAKMFHYYNLNRDEFLAHYHKRSNVETTNMMIKAKFGDSIRSKTDTAMVNEALCKVLCHNICCLIQSQYELGIVPVFWKDEPVESGAAEPAALPEPNDFAELMAWV
jgi:transposase